MDIFDCEKQIIWLRLKCLDLYSRLQKNKNKRIRFEMTNSQLPKAVIFDWDNTLVDTWSLIQDAIDKTMTKMGQEPWGLEKVKNNVSKSMRESFPAIFGYNWQKAGEIYKNQYHANNLKNLVFLEGAQELIEYLYQKKIILFIVSNKIGTTLRKEAESLGVKDKFFSIVGATDAAYDKPDKAPVELALQDSDLNPQKDLIWFIGDTIVDIECAYNSDCKPVLYGNGESISENFIKQINEEKSQSLLKFSNHQEILKYFKELFLEK